MSERLRILTWNLGEALAATQQTIADTLRHFDADLVFLNEVMVRGVLGDGRYGDDQTLFLARQLGYPHYMWCETAMIAGGNVKGVSILSRHPLFGWNPQPALKDPNFGGNYRALEVQADIAGRRWYLYTLRFSAYDEGNNTRHCALLRDRIRSLPADVGVIAAGDFNGGTAHERLYNATGRTDESVVQRLPPAFQDLVNQAGLIDSTDGLGLNYDREWHTDPAFKFPPYSRALDLILYRPPAGLPGLRRLRVVEDRANIGTEAHMFLYVELGQPGIPQALSAITDLLNAGPTRIAKRPVVPRRPGRPRPRPG